MMKKEKSSSKTQKYRPWDICNIHFFEVLILVGYGAVSLGDVCPVFSDHYTALTHWVGVTQISVFTLQLRKTDDANLRFEHALIFPAQYT